MNARIDRLKELLKRSPGDAFTRFALAKEYEKEGMTDEAISGLRSLLSESPDYLGAYYHLGSLLRDSGELTEALEVFDRGIGEARSQGDRHAMSELQNARMNLELELEG